MAKMEGASIARVISISDLIETGNVREDYTGIEELAESIKKNGLLEPVLVKPAAPADDGSPRFELIAGHRRVKACRYLTENGDDFSHINAMLVSGDRLTIQLIENMQRNDLTARERERGIFLMTQNGFTQREVAAELSKGEVYVSRHIAAYKLRKIAEEKGIDTSTLETSVLDIIRAAKNEDVPMLVQYIINTGGTMSAARAVIKDYRGNKPKETPEEMPPEGDTAEYPADIPPAEPAGEIDPALPPPEAEKREEETKPRPPAAPVERMSVEHKQVDVHDIFDEIYTYVTAVNNRIKELGPDAEQSRIAEIKKEAALDIISLIHKRIDNV
ncbi:MAG: ParB/RepB/Spo0J family partition protein [Treponema sp.]|jgi:ParB/RepB/Spo0J family partition protein|nr:ParB/RepB/Spo0J family partition protein [Treponema sp.]